MFPNLTNHLILPTGGYVSAQVTIADLDGDGQPEIIAGSDALYVWRLDGRFLSGFPVQGRNFFASRPAVGDLDGDGQNEILVGCDDGHLYGFDSSGGLLPGWPIKTACYDSKLCLRLPTNGTKRGKRHLCW